MEGVTYMRMKFYVKGSLRSGTVQLDMKKVSFNLSSTICYASSRVYLCHRMSGESMS